MPWWAQALLSLGVALLVAWGALIIALLMAKPSQAALREALRLLYRTGDGLVTDAGRRRRPARAALTRRWAPKTKT